jgi:hypothetical protein
MINLYDEYTHITLDRRAYLARMTALVGTTAAATAVTSLIEADKASAQIVQPNDPRLKTGRFTYPGEGGEMAGYLAMPANATGRLPAVIVIHENRGLVPHIQDVTRRMALEGFLALGPDFLHQAGGTPADEDKGRDMIGQLDRARTVANAVASVRFLKAHAAGNGKSARRASAGAAAWSMLSLPPPGRTWGPPRPTTACRCRPTTRARSRRVCCCITPPTTTASMRASRPTGRRSTRLA